jgi:hypothetical protein
MEAFFDNKTNILNAHIRAAHDKSILYILKSDTSLLGRKVTTVEDANPLIGNSAIVGLIHWQEKIFEVLGEKKKYSEIKRQEGRIFKR